MPKSSLSVQLIATQDYQGFVLPIRVAYPLLLLKALIAGSVVSEAPTLKICAKPFGAFGRSKEVAALFIWLSDLREPVGNIFENSNAILDLSLSGGYRPTDVLSGSA